MTNRVISTLRPYARNEYADATQVFAEAYSFSSPMLAALVATALALASPASDPQDGISVLVTGAAGRTGKILYKYLKEDKRVGEVRALIYGTGAPKDIQKAKAALNCSKCDSSEGIYYGDVTKPATLTTSFKGIDTVAVTTAVGGAGFSNDTLTKLVEFTAWRTRPRPSWPAPPT